MTKKTLNGICLALSLFCVHSVMSAEPIDLVIYQQAVNQSKSGVHHLTQPEEQTVLRMDSMLKEQYGAVNSINSEPNAYLKKIYQQTSWLLLNGYPISGGTLVQIARTKAEFKGSPVGPYLVRFVDTLLEPTEDDGDEFGLLIHSQVAKRVLTGLEPLPNRLKMPAQLHVIGLLYHDDIAYKSGLTALKDRVPTQQEWSVINKQIDVVKQAKLPDPVGQ